MFGITPQATTGEFVIQYVICYRRKKKKTGLNLGHSIFQIREGQVHMQKEAFKENAKLLHRKKKFLVTI